MIKWKDADLEIKVFTILSLILQVALLGDLIYGIIHTNSIGLRIYAIIVIIQIVLSAIGTFIFLFLEEKEE